MASYDLTLDWQPAGNRLTGTAVITAKATQNLSRFDLDLRGFTISAAARGRRAWRRSHATASRSS